jgi:UDP-N-acetylmuramoyl-tripeptide--D-alanyl-D-alanine ligase
MGSAGIDFAVGVRGLARAIVEGARASKINAEFVSTPEEAGEWLKHRVKPGDAVLLKASRGVRLERALETWTGKVSQRTH